jgi:hypothetical protein
MALGATIDAATRLVINGTGTSSGTYGLQVRTSGGTTNFRVDDSGGCFARTVFSAGTDVVAGNAVRTATGIGWDFGPFTTGSDVASIGYVTVSIAGTSYRLMVRA